MDKRYRILAVDDEYVNTQLIKSVLHVEYDILTAINGHEAIALVKQYKPDLILLDVMMPDLSGFDVCRIIRADAVFDAIPVIFLTALDSQEGELQGLELGGIDYLTKPVNLELLKLRVRNHLAMKEQRDQLARQKAELEVALAELEVQNERQRVTDAEKRMFEQQYQQAQKLESLGVLAGGIAHDFNNILAIIIGYCGLTKIDYEKAEINISHIEKAAERAASLCSQMLAYAGKAQFIVTQVNMTALVNEMVAMMKATTKQNVVIISDLSANLPPLMGDASQLRQIVMNLIVNAAEAIGDSQGVIKVSLTEAVFTVGQGEKDHLGTLIPAGCYICLEISDTGCGMDEETKRRIFEPFYTTKFSGRGLGMSATLGIITAHKGALQLYSRQGHGSAFKIYLPAQNSDAADTETLRQAVPAPWQGSGTILLVEDEEQVMQVARDMLEALGFTVVEACNGKDALSIYRKNASDIMLVVTDIGMPIMDGYALFRELKTVNPSLPIIISSGYGDAEVISKIAHADIAGLFSKPYNFDKMREVLQSVVAPIKCST
ncbi:MAG: response regulator [Desulfuromonadaceae bacterium]|nr:response regulator [Desulfuromonadaceae bacterium]